VPVQRKRPKAFVALSPEVGEVEYELPHVVYRTVWRTQYFGNGSDLRQAFFTLIFMIFMISAARRGHDDHKNLRLSASDRTLRGRFLTLISYDL
jgi:hypothetical protein